VSGRSPEKEEETFAAASTTAAYREQYDIANPSELRFSVGTKTPAANTIAQYENRQAEMHLKQPPEIIIPMLPMMPTFPGEIVALKNDTWICHGCDEEVAAGKRRCRCGCWRDGVRGPTKKKPEVKNAPNYKKAATSKAGRKPKHGLPLNVECSGGLVVAADGLNIEGTVPTSSPLTGGNSIIDEDPTDNDSIQTLSTAARQRESDLDVVVLLNQQDQIEKGDGGDSDIEGDGEDVAMSFVESMVEVGT
jgi:hypothetical protein